MTDKYSSFTLNVNPAASGNDKAPTLKGASKVLEGAEATEFEVAAWGPNKPQTTSGPDYYNLSLRPKDPALAARQLRSEVDASSIPNAIAGFEITKLGTGKIFERTDEEIARGKAQGKNLPKFYGHALALTKAGPRYVDLSAWKRTHEGREFYSGNANLHDPGAAAEARAAAGRPARAPGPQNG